MSNAAYVPAILKAIGLAAADLMIGFGTDFIPKVIRTAEDRLYADFRNGIAAVFDFISGEGSEDVKSERLPDI